VSLEHRGFCITKELLVIRSLQPVLALASVALFATPGAFAADQPSYPGPGIGIGVAVQSRPYKDADSETRVLPVLSYENRWVRVAGLGLDLKLGSAGPVSFALGARYAFNGYEAGDAPILAGMAERKGGLWVGPSVAWRGDFADVSAEVLGDASGHSKGTQVRLGVDRSFQSGAVRLTPRVAAIWRDKKYNDYYWGVRATEVRTDRPFYQASAGTDMEVGLRTAYLLSREQSVFFDVSATAYGRGEKNSPLVDTRGTVGVRMGYLYRF
jgi:MipA family protein